jgi:hypothetical protein
MPQIRDRHGQPSKGNDKGGVEDLVGYAALISSSPRFSPANVSLFKSARRVHWLRTDACESAPIMTLPRPRSLIPRQNVTGQYLHRPDPAPICTKANAER